MDIERPDLEHINAMVARLSDERATGALHVSQSMVDAVSELLVYTEHLEETQDELVSGILLACASEMDAHLLARQGAPTPVDCPDLTQVTDTSVLNYIKYLEAERTYLLGHAIPDAYKRGYEDGVRDETDTDF